MLNMMLPVPGINYDLDTGYLVPVCAQINKLPDWKSHAYPYITNEFTVEIDEMKRAEELGKLLVSYNGCFRLHMMAHSNGTRVVVSAIQYSKVQLETLHLICGAIDADFDKNGINDLMMLGRIKNVFVYWAEKDSALRIENTLPGKVLFELPITSQPLGLSGPLKVNQLDKVKIISWPDFDHSTCWEADNLSNTVDQVINNTTCNL